MEEEKRTRLLQVGVDIDGGLERFMDNEALFLKCLRRFPTDTSFQQLEEALSAGDLQAAFVAAHTLKGVSGNLSLDAVFQASLPVVEALRCDNRIAQREILSEAHKRIIDRGISVRMVLTEYVTYYAGAFLVGGVVSYAKLPHII